MICYLSFVAADGASNHKPNKNMSLIIAKNKVNFEQLMGVETPEGTDTHTPIGHHALVSLTREAIAGAGLTIL
jgi:hypothetical protein